MASPSLDPHKHRYIFQALSAMAVVAFIYCATNVLPYYPANWRTLILLATGVIWLVAPVWSAPLPPTWEKTFNGWMPTCPPRDG